jgi:hypothetical protein
MKEKEKEQHLDESSAAVVWYYDSLTDEEIAEDRAWGEFAASQFPTYENEQPIRQTPAPNPKR